MNKISRPYTARILNQRINRTRKSGRLRVSFEAVICTSEIVRLQDDGRLPTGLEFANANLYADEPDVIAAALQWVNPAISDLEAFRKGHVGKADLSGHYAVVMGNRFPHPAFRGQFAVEWKLYAVFPKGFVPPIVPQSVREMPKTINSIAQAKEYFQELAQTVQTSDLQLEDF